MAAPGVQELLELDLETRLALVQKLWDSIVDDASSGAQLPLADEVLAELDAMIEAVQVMQASSRRPIIRARRERARGCSKQDARLPSRSGAPRLARSGTTLLRTRSVLLSGDPSCIRVVPPLASPRSTRRAGAPRVVVERGSRS